VGFASGFSTIRLPRAEILFGRQFEGYSYAQEHSVLELEGNWICKLGTADAALGAVDMGWPSDAGP
jgi:hypothetical protein